MKNKNRVLDFLIALIPFVMLFVLWILFYHYQVIPHWILASPLEVCNKLKQITVDGTLWKLLIITIGNATIAFGVALILALIIGMAIGLNNNIKKILLPFLSFLYPIPSLGWLPLVVILFGFSRLSVWIIVAISAFFKIVFSVINGIRGVDRNLIWAAKNLGFKGPKFVYKIILPAAFPQIMAGIRIGFGSAWRSLIGAEIIVPAVGGLGSYISMSQWQFHFDQVIAGLIIIALISYIAEKLVFERIEEKTLVKYGLIRH